jgi:hypothetical protein
VVRGEVGAQRTTGRVLLAGGFEADPDGEWISHEGASHPGGGGGGSGKAGDQHRRCVHRTHQNDAGEWEQEKQVTMQP